MEAKRASPGAGNRCLSGMPGPYADGVPEMKDFPELHGRRFIEVSESEARVEARRGLDCRSANQVLQ